MKKTIIILATVLLASFSNSIIAAGDAEAGQTKSATCMGCHGLAGNSEIASFPKLAGQGEAYLLKQLQNFKSGERNNAIMAGVASLLSEQDMMDIAAYYSIQTISENSAKGDAKTIELGRKIYVGGKMDTQTTACIACHGPKGLGIPTAGFPSLSAQHADYIAVQLKAFRQYSINEQTGSDDVSRTNEMMVNVAKGLTTVEIEALAQYIAGLH
ncbi:MAG TPA: cytochrome c4 [Candidatus Thioglobus sp.]|jgi:cytochrome c553|nr:cytochrome c4 [Candidatus Thioglobus sp.]HIL44598.1 cytochrome c4 [Candidatus Thioglobus sp.]